MSSNTERFLDIIKETKKLISFPLTLSQSHCSSFRYSFFPLFLCLHLISVQCHYGSLKSECILMQFHNASHFFPFILGLDLSVENEELLNCDSLIVYFGVAGA